MRREIIIKKSLHAGYIPNEITALSQVIFVNIIYELLIRLMSLFLLLFAYGIDIYMYVSIFLFSHSFHSYFIYFWWMIGEK